MSIYNRFPALLFVLLGFILFSSCKNRSPNISGAKEYSDQAASEPAGSFTAFVKSDFPEGRLPNSNEFKEALRKVLIEAGVKAKIETATQKGAIKKRYLLKIAVNDGRGLAGYPPQDPVALLAGVAEILTGQRDRLLDGIGPEDQEKMNNVLALLEPALALFQEIIEACEARTVCEENLSGSEKERARTLVPLISNVLEDGRNAVRQALWGIVAKQVSIALGLIGEVYGTGSWDVVGYPAVVGPHMVRAYAELIREWGGEPWIGDRSGVESPFTYENMKVAGLVEAAAESGASLWIFDKGQVDLTASDEKYIENVDGQDLVTYTNVTVGALEHYPNKTISIPSAMTLESKFFEGIFFAAYPKAHILTDVSSAIKNFVGMLEFSSRRHMHNLKESDPPFLVMASHNNKLSHQDNSSDLKIAEMAFVIQNALGPKVMGYIGDSLATITNLGPDTGPAAYYDPRDWTVTYSNDLYIQELSTLSVSCTGIRHLQSTQINKPFLYNDFFRTCDPTNDRLTKLYRGILEKQNKPVGNAEWKIFELEQGSKMTGDLRELNKNKLNSMFSIKVSPRD